MGRIRRAVVLAVSFLLVPFIVEAQQAASLPRIGF
jgi:hypothetical protein